MQTKMTWIVLATLTAGGLYGQTSGNVKLDTPQVRVVVSTENPHQPGAPHDYSLGGGLIFFGPGQATVASKQDGAEKIDFKRGDFHWIPPSRAYVIENTGDQPFQVAEIELKSKPTGPLPETALDPVKVDPKHYQVEFESDRVRVLRIQFGPHETSARHEHILNRVVCYVTDHARLKAGAVHMSGAAIHIEKNPMDQPVERIAVELK